MTLVVTLATIPSRIETLQPCLESIMSQTITPDKIYLWYPSKFVRFKERKEIPAYLREYPLEIHDLHDHVALNKLTGALQYVEGPDTKIVSIDDDMVYPRHFLENLSTWSDHYPHAAIGHKGKILIKDAELNYDKVYIYSGRGEKPCAVDVLDAAYGILYKTRFFKKEALAPEVIDAPFVSHDLWFSGNLAQNLIPQLVVPYSEYNGMRAYQEEVDALMLMPERDNTKHVTMMHFEEAFRNNCTD